MLEPYPNLSARHLSAVVAVAEYRSFIAAASAIGVSQPALTRLIKQVEEELGVMLFSRSTRHVSVNAAGGEFAAHADRFLKDLKLSIGNVRDKAQAPRGQIVVSSVLSLASVVLPELISDYSRRFPGVEIHLREGLHGAVRDEVRSGLADFGVCYIDDLTEGFVSQAIGKERLYVVLPKEHQLVRRRAIGLHQLACESMVSFPAEARTRRAVDAEAASRALSIRYSVTTNRLPTLFDLVRNRVGLAVVPFSERPAAENAGLVYRPLMGRGMSSTLGTIQLRARELSAPAKALLDQLRVWVRVARRKERRSGR